jgi:hypothetical protein
MEATRFFTTFVSYGTPDLEFATRLVGALEAKGVKCWFYPRDYSPGKRTQAEIAQKRRDSERLVVLCSYKSLLQDGVLSEIDDQIREDPDKLIPISLDDVWLQPGYRVMWNTTDLKPFLKERNYADFTDAAAYEHSLGQLLGALVNTRPAARPTTTAALAKRLKNIESLLRLRADANDLSFVAQILDAFAAILMLKYDLVEKQEEDDPKLYEKLIGYLDVATSSSPLVRDLDALEGAWTIVTLRQRLRQVRSAIDHSERSSSTIALIQATLAQLYIVVASLITADPSEYAADAKVQLAVSRKEDDHIEFKSTLRYNLVTGLVDPAMEAEVIRAIAGMANYEGGKVYIGVKDNGEILGAELDLATFKGENAMDQFRRHFDQLVSERFGVANYQVVEASWDDPGSKDRFVDLDGKSVFVVKVKPVNEPIFVKGAGNESDFYLRRGARTVKLSTREFYEYYRARWRGEPPMTAQPGMSQEEAVAE